MSAPAREGRRGVDVLRALAERAGRPLGVHLQVADRCNHACRHCYQVQGLKGELDLDGVRAVIDDLADVGVLTLNVSGGEATLRPDLVDILRHARARGFAVRLYTNAFLVDDAMADALAAVGLHEVHVSVYSGVAAEHDAVTRVPGSFARTTAGVRALRARGVRVVLKCPATSLAPEGAQGVAAIAEETGCAFAPSTELTPREDGALDPLAVRGGEAQLARAGLLKPWSPGGGDAAALRAQKLTGASCGVGSSGLVVLPDGAVLPCTDTPVVVGRLTESPMREVLATSDALAMMRELTWGDVHGCRDCALLGGCHRCHATALHEAGDYLGPYPSACARARARYALGGGDAEPAEPDPSCEPGRDPKVGPYRVDDGGRLVPMPDRRSAEDDLRAARFPWIRKAPRETLVTLRVGRSGAASGASKPAPAPGAVLDNDASSLLLVE